MLRETHKINLNTRKNETNYNFINSRFEIKRNLMDEIRVELMTFPC